MTIDADSSFGHITSSFHRKTRPRLYRRHFVRYSEPSLGFFFFWKLTPFKIAPTELERWYSVRVAQVLELPGGHSLLKHKFGSSLLTALSDAFPEHKWVPWRFSKSPAGLWKLQLTSVMTASALDNRRAFFKWLGEKLGVKRLEDWYHISFDEIVQNGGAGLLRNYYNDSIYTALREIYPEHIWHPWEFTRLPKGSSHTSDKVQLAELVAFIEKKLGLTPPPKLSSKQTDLADWYRVSAKQIQSLKLTRTVQANGGLGSILAQVYPSHPWDLSMFSSGPRPAAAAVSKSKSSQLKIAKDVWSVLESPSETKQL